MADTVCVGKKTEKRDVPQHRPEEDAFVELWKPQLHLNKAFLEPGEDTAVLIRTAADDFLFRVTAEIAIRENFLEKYSTVGGGAVYLRVNRGWQTDPVRLPLDRSDLFSIPADEYFYCRKQYKHDHPQTKVSSHDKSLL